MANHHTAIGKVEPSGVARCGEGRSVPGGNPLESAFSFNRFSHEIRTPLNIVSGFSDLLLDELEGVISPEQLQNLREIRKSSDKILRILNRYEDRVNGGGQP